MELVHARETCRESFHAGADSVSLNRFDEANFFGLIRLEFGGLIRVEILYDVNLRSSITVLNPPIFEPLNHVELAPLEC